ncbi:MAG: anti-sigma factor [Pedococcus sp.]
MSADVHSLVGAYAVDAIDEQERTTFERHLATCPECRDEVSTLRAAAASLSLVGEVTPPASLRTAVLAGIRTVSQLPAPDQTGTGPSTPKARIPVIMDDDAGEPTPGAGPGDLPSNVIPLRRRPVAHWLVGAAAAVALIAGGIAWSPWNDGPANQTISASEQVLQAPDAQRVVHNVDGAKVTIVRSPSLRRAVIVADNMPSAPEGKDFQVWFNQPNQGMVSAGVMPHGAAPTVSVPLEGDASTALAVGITLEPAGGSPEPTTAPLALFAFS